MIKNNKGSRCGFSLIELIVVAGIVAVLMTMLLPAVQAVREAGKATACRNKLRQTILGIHGFESATGIVANQRGFSFLVDLLPWLDHSQFYNQLDLSLGSAHASNVKVFADNQISTFRCPSQPASGRWAENGNSYVGCVGNAWFFRGDDGNPSRFAERDGLFAPRINRLARVIDGLSNTIALSESGPGKLSSYIRVVKAYHDGMSVSEMDSLLSNTPVTSQNIVVGIDWTSNGLGDSLYNHYLPPNQASGTLLDGEGVYSSSSYHPNGVNAARTDGSVFFVSNNISRNTWLQLGSAVDGGVDFKGF
jgi:prepilin-type N-terminal cleavage/methylation domain-containing protein